MSFAGLQKRLEKKATTTSNSVPDVDNKLNNNNNSKNSSNSIYEIALQEVRANHPERKRQRSPCSDDKEHKTATTVNNENNNDNNTLVKTPPEPLTTERVRPKILTEEEFQEQRKFAEEVISHCATQMSQIIKSNNTSSSTTISDIKLDEISQLHRVTLFPLSLCRLLQKRLQLRQLSSAAATATAQCDEEENEFLKILNTKLEDEDIKPPIPVTSPLLKPLINILRTFWLALCCHWRMSINGSAAGKNSSEFGWTYNVYLLSRHVLPDLIRRTHGREIALALEAWREAYRVRQNILDFLAYTLHDVEEILQNLNNNNNNNNNEKKEDTISRIIPVEIVDSISQMLIHLRQREFVASRQVYVDLTMGTANWKLGLFSGGEVHMRRSMERIERRRIAHILHNETAMRLLHALRELMDFVQQHELALNSSGIFINEK